MKPCMLGLNLRWVVLPPALPKSEGKLRHMYRNVQVFSHQEPPSICATIHVTNWLIHWQAYMSIKYATPLINGLQVCFWGPNIWPRWSTSSTHVRRSKPPTWSRFWSFVVRGHICPRPICVWPSPPSEGMTSWTAKPGVASPVKFISSQILADVNIYL